MDLTQDFEKAANAYERYLVYSVNNASKEVWSTGYYFHVELFDFEKNGFLRGSLLIKNPTWTKQKYCYLFNENNELIEMQQGLNLPNQLNREFFFYENYLLKNCLYGTSKSIINVKFRVLYQGKINEVFLLDKRGSKHEKYFYGNDVLTRVRVEQWNADQQGVPYDALFKYEGSELVSIINKFDNGYEKLQCNANK
jgi:hypothetical protein